MDRVFFIDLKLFTLAQKIAKETSTLKHVSIHIGLYWDNFK